MLEEIKQTSMMQEQKTIKTDQADLKTDNMYYLWTLNMLKILRQLKEPRSGSKLTNQSKGVGNLK